MAASLIPRAQLGSEAVDVDRGQLVGRGLKDVAVVMNLHELAPVGRWATSGRAGRRLEWFAEVCENLPDRPRLGLALLANVAFSPAP